MTHDRSSLSRQRPGSPSRSSIIARPSWPRRDFRRRGDGCTCGRRPALGALAIDPRTLIVIKTHSFAHDRDWLNVFLGTRAPYIGLLGPRARASELLGLLGVDADERVYAPVGLNIGADGPEQIAISIVGELLAVLARQQPGTCAKRGSPFMPAERTGPSPGSSWRRAPPLAWAATSCSWSSTEHRSCVRWSNARRRQASIRCSSSSGTRPTRSAGARRPARTSR